MAHFSRGTQVFKKPIYANDMDGNGKQYRITAWINMRTNWNDSLERYEEMTQQQKKDCEYLFSEMQKYGAQLSITISERTDSLDVREFPVAARTTLYVNNKQQNNSAAQPQQTNTTDTENVSTGFE